MSARGDRCVASQHPHYRTTRSLINLTEQRHPLKRTTRLTLPSNAIHITQHRHPHYRTMQLTLPNITIHFTEQRKLLYRTTRLTLPNNTIHFTEPNNVIYCTEHNDAVMHFTELSHPLCRLITYWPARSMLTHFRRRARDAHRPSTSPVHFTEQGDLLYRTT